LALKLGGFEKVRKLTMLQVRLLAGVMADDQLFQAKIHGYEVKGEKPKAHYATTDDIRALASFMGAQLVPFSGTGD